MKAMNSNFKSKIMLLSMAFLTSLILAVHIQSIMAQSDNGNFLLPGNAIIVDGNGQLVKNGTNGQNGADGQPGSFSHSGANGQNGANGQDG